VSFTSSTIKRTCDAFYLYSTQNVRPEVPITLHICETKASSSSWRMRATLHLCKQTVFLLM